MNLASLKLYMVELMNISNTCPIHSHTSDLTAGPLFAITFLTNQMT